MKQYHEITKALKEADAVLIGASNGFSISEGLHLFAENQAFIDLFSDFRRKYGIRNILQGCSFSYPSETEKWAFWSRLIWHYNGKYKGSPNTENLKKLITNKPYLIVTSNGEGHFSLSGFDVEKIIELEGNWLTMQCAHACHRTLYPTLEMIKEMAQAEKNGYVPDTLIPKCPKCGGNMQIHVPINGYFIPNEMAQEKFNSFIQEFHGKKLAVLEMGIGYKNQMIKAPFMELVQQNPNAIYITINKGEIYIPAPIREKSYGLDGDIIEILSLLASEYDSTT